MKRLLYYCMFFAMLLVSACGKEITITPEQQGKQDGGQQEQTTLINERDALIAFYNALDGKKWKQNRNWCSDSPIDQWYGVTTDKDGHVTGISLPNNNLKGCIPEAIGKLEQLQELDLKSNLISAPIPSALQAMNVWKEFWGDILYGNLVYKSQFLSLNVKVPKHQKERITGDKYTYLLQWTPEKKGLSDDQYTKDSLVVDYFKHPWYSGIGVAAWCVNVPANVISQAAQSRDLPWNNEAETISYPIHDFCPAWVLCSPDGTIVDTNLLSDPEGPETGGIPDDDPPIPGYKPLRIEVEYTAMLDFGPSLAVVEDLSKHFEISTNKDISKVHLKTRTYYPWIRLAENMLAVNGNPSVKERKGTVIVSIYYDTLYYGSFSIDINQAGVYATFTGESNITEFDLYRNSNFSVHTIGFTPYGGTITIPVSTNCDGCLDPLSSDAYPQLLTGDTFVPDSGFPTITGDKNALVIHYDSNPSSNQKGCLLSYIPLIGVVENWNDPANSYVAHYVDNGNGNIMYLSFCALQSPVIITAEYSSYVAEAMAPSSTEQAGYNRLKAYSDVSSQTVAKNAIFLYSNVKWGKSDLFIGDSSIPYLITNSVSVAGDGKKIEETKLDMFLRNTLTYTTTINDEKQYRPQEDHDSRRTELKVDLDLRDGNPFSVTLAYLWQPGIPHTTWPSGSGGSCTEGAYQYDGYTYKYRVSFSVEVNTVLDGLTEVFCGQPELKAYSTHGKVEDYYKWHSFPKWGTSYSGYLYCNGSTEMVFDWRVPLSNGVYVYAEYQPKITWVEQTTYSFSAPQAPAHISAKNDHSVFECKYLGKPRMEPAIPRVPERPSGPCYSAPALSNPALQQLSH